MTKVVGPAFSLAATGTLGGAVTYVDSPFGHIVRVKERGGKTFSQRFIDNQVLFAAASDRWDTLDAFQKRAWEIYAYTQCDSARCQFMGYQIDKWIMWHGNDVSWPPDPTYSIPEPVSYASWPGVYVKYRLAIDEYKWARKYRVAGSRWYAGVSCVVPPTLDQQIDYGIDFHGQERYTAELGRWIWVRLIRTNGSEETIWCVGNFETLEDC